MSSGTGEPCLAAARQARVKPTRTVNCMMADLVRESLFWWLSVNLLLMRSKGGTGPMNERLLDTNGELLVEDL